MTFVGSVPVPPECQFCQNTLSWKFNLKWQPHFRLYFHFQSIPSSRFEIYRFMDQGCTLFPQNRWSLVLSGLRNQTPISNQLAWHWTVTSFNCTEHCSLWNSTMATDVLQSWFIFTAPLQCQFIIYRNV